MPLLLKKKKIAFDRYFIERDCYLQQPRGPELESAVKILVPSELVGQASSIQKVGGT